MDTAEFSVFLCDLSKLLFMTSEQQHPFNILDFFTWLKSDRVAEAVAALSSIFTAIVAFFALCGTIIAILISRRIARYAYEPWLELVPEKVRRDIEWDPDDPVGVCMKDEPGDKIGRHLWGQAFNSPSWRLVNVGNGPALRMVALWRVDRLMLEVALGKCMSIFDKRLESRAGTIYDLHGNRPVIGCKFEDSSYLGFRVPTQMPNVQDELTMPSRIFGGIALHAISVTDKNGGIGDARGTLDLTIKYSDKFNREMSRKFQFGYDVVAFIEKSENKRIVKAIIEIEPKASAVVSPLLERLLGQKASYRLRAAGKLISLEYQKRRALYEMRRDLRKLPKK